MIIVHGLNGELLDRFLFEVPYTQLEPETKFSIHNQDKLRDFESAGLLAFGVSSGLIIYLLEWLKKQPEDIEIELEILKFLKFKINRKSNQKSLEEEMKVVAELEKKNNFQEDE